LRFPKITLDDLSFITYTFQDGAKVFVSLKKLNILTTGRTWYNNFGFFQDNMIDNEANIMSFININVNNIEEIFKNNRNIDMQRDFSEYLRRFSEEFGFSINESTTIQNLFQQIKDYLRLFQGRIISASELVKITVLESFINFVYNLMLNYIYNRRIPVRPDPFEKDFKMIITGDSMDISDINGGRRKSKKSRRKIKSKKSKKYNKSKKCNKSKKFKY